MQARSVLEAHRVSSALELLFDLTFVVAVGRITGAFAERIAAGETSHGIAPFLQVFFAIWWAWMNFTWFASAYDTDDVTYRLLTVVQMAGVLVLAAGVPAATRNDFTAITIGYTIMRTALVLQWLRAAKDDPGGRTTALRYAAGIAVAEALWLTRLVLARVGALPRSSLSAVFVALVVLELAVPAWAEHRAPTSWHPHHIGERYGLFVIILLGECILRTSASLDEAVDGTGVTGDLLTLAIAGLALLFGLWWLYFLVPAGHGLANNRERSYLWGYGHYGIFAALAALGAGLEVAIEHLRHPHEIASSTVTVALAIPVMAFLLLLLATHAAIRSRLLPRPPILLGAVVAIGLVALVSNRIGVPRSVAGMAIVCALLVATTVRETVGD